MARGERSEQALHATIRSLEAQVRELQDAAAAAPGAALSPEQQSLLLEMARTAQVGGWRVDLGEDRVIWTEETYRIHEVRHDYIPTVDEAIEFFTPAAQPLIRGAVETALARGVPYDLELPIVTAQGNQRWIHTIGQAVRQDGEVVAIQGTVQDITERREAQEAQRTSRERLTKVLENIDEGFFVLDHDLRVTFYNASAAVLLGRPPEEVIGQRLFDAFPEMRGSELETRYRRALREQRPDTFEVYFEPEPYSNWYEIRVSPFEDGIAVYFRVTTARKQAEAALRASEEQLRTFLENVDDMVYSQSLDGALSLLNRANERITGYSLAEFEADPQLWRKIVHPEDRAVAEAFFQQHPEGVPAHEALYRLRRKSGEWRWIQSRMVAARDENGHITGYNCIDRDVTESRQLEERLRQAQKMEAVGQLAGGVAHDFNNVLTAILGNTELLRLSLESRLDPDDPALEGLNQVERAGQRATVLTRQLLAFSRKQLVQPETIDPVRLLVDMDKMLRRLIRENIEFEVSYPDKSWSVRADAGQIEQVVMNLVVNARDAMLNGGKLSIALSNVTLDQTHAASYPEARTGPYVVISVSDTGVGMDEATQRRMFEPFYTTKAAGRGTGLGLATVHGIVRQAGGHIAVDSAPGAGATFRVYLPAITDVAEQLDVEDVLPAPPGGCETILICEDDRPVRELTMRTLSERGYQVLAADEAATALEMAADYGEPIHLLLTDVIMPGLNGRELAERLTLQRPEMKVLYVSGYTSDIIGEQGVLTDGEELLPKPFNSHDLLTRVRAVLDEDGAS